MIQVAATAGIGLPPINQPERETYPGSVRGFSFMATLSLSPASKAARAEKFAKQTPQTLPNRKQRQADQRAFEEAAHARKIQVIIWLDDNYPDIFVWPPRPLSIGITERIILARPEFASKKNIRNPLNHWCSQPLYKTALVIGAVRYNEYGQEDGVVGK